MTKAQKNVILLAVYSAMRELEDTGGDRFKNIMPYSAQMLDDLSVPLTYEHITRIMQKDDCGKTFLKHMKGVNEKLVIEDVILVTKNALSELNSDYGWNFRDDMKQGDVRRKDLAFKVFVKHLCHCRSLFPYDNP